MQRIEPSNIHAFSGPLMNEAKARVDLPPPPPIETDDPPRVEVSRVRLPEDSGGVTPWASFLFILFWLGGISAYVVGFFGYEAVVQLKLAQEVYGLIAAALFVPIVLAVFIAILAREAHRLRRESESLALAAANLIEPDEHAARGLARLGRTIRRELDQFNSAVEGATARMANLETQANERLALIERSAAAAQERVDRATGKLGAEREKLAQFTQALDTAVLSASETLTQRLNDARTAARSASESLHAEHGAIAGLISTLQAASTTVAAKASESAKEIERQAQRLDAASEAAAARSEQVVARHERQRAALAETIERLKNENDHMARALDYQREGMSKLVAVMGEETKKIGHFTIDGARRLDETAALMAQRIVETTQLFTRESEKLRTSTELTTSGLEQAMQVIRSAGDNSFDAAGRLGSVLIGLRETASSASQQIESTVARLAKLLQELPAEAAIHAQHLRTVLDQQAGAINDLTTRVSVAFDRVQAIEGDKQPAQAQLKAPPSQPSIPNFSVPPTGHLAPPNRNTVPQPTEKHVALSSSPAGEGPEPRGWFGLAKRLVRTPNDGLDAPPSQADERGGAWDMKDLLAAAEKQGHTTHRRVEPRSEPQRPDTRHHADVRRETRTPHQEPRTSHHELRTPAPRAAKPAAPAPSALPRGGANGKTPPKSDYVSSRHMLETLQAMAIDLDRYFEDDPRHDLMKRYRSGERDVFARRLVAIMQHEQSEGIGRKYDSDGEFRDTVDSYLLQFETLMEQTARSDHENNQVEAYLNSQTGRVYVALASATGRLA